jgi:hypothetical protein
MLVLEEIFIFQDTDDRKTVSHLSFAGRVSRIPATIPAGPSVSYRVPSS